MVGGDRAHGNLLALFAAGNIADIIANQGFTGVFAIWSVGFTLWLPWPLYGVSLALYLYTMLTCFSTRGDHASGSRRQPGHGVVATPLCGILPATYLPAHAGGVGYTPPQLTGLAHPLRELRRTPAANPVPALVTPEV